MPNDFDTKEGRAEYRRKHRMALAALGYRRLDITISPHLWARLEPHLRGYGGDDFPGSALVEWLENLDL